MSSHPTKPTIAIFGATGTQGSSVVSALLSDPSHTYTPRIITRSPSSGSARAFETRGCEVARVDVMKDGEGLDDAVRGCVGVFLVTIPFDPRCSEVEQGRMVVDACKRANVEFIVWSSLPEVTNASGGEFKNVVHFDQKAAVDEILRTSGLRHAILHTSFFLENLQNQLLKPSKTDVGGLDFILWRIPPAEEFPYTWISRDMGVVALALFKKHLIGGTTSSSSSAGVEGGEPYNVSSGLMKGTELRDILERVLGIKVNLISPPATGMPAVDEMMDFNKKYRTYPYGTPDRRLVEELGIDKFGTLEEYVRENADVLKACAVVKDGEGGHELKF